MKPLSQGDAIPFYACCRGVAGYNGQLNSHKKLLDNTMDNSILLRLYRFMLTSRKIDLAEEALAHRGEAPFFVPNAGHEAIAAIEPHLTPNDWLQSHYRDKALLLARGLPIEEFFYALLAKHESSSHGRNLPGFLSSPSLKILNPPTVVGNNGLHAVGVAKAIKHQPGHPIVLCSTGDGATQEGEFLEAIGAAIRSHLPVLFIIEDNRYALSTPTRGQTFFSLPSGPAKEYCGMPIHRIDGTDAVTAYHKLGEVVARMRAHRGPEIVIFHVERLTSHTNADDHTVYRHADDIREIKDKSDPIRKLAIYLNNAGISKAELDACEEEVDTAVKQALELARRGQPPQPEFEAKKPLPPELTNHAAEYRGIPSPRPLSMLEAMRETLRHHLQTDKRVSLFGEDIEDPKGDVFGLTRGLSAQFPGRVTNSPLSEATILGMSIGRALAGERPVALIQFADFLPVAYNQIFSELANIHWRTKGDWQAPVIVLAICGAYRPGLGAFHAQTPVTLAAHTPGVDVFMPSTAADAAGLLNAAFKSERPTIFFYPKNLINDRTVVTSEDVPQHLIPIGKARVTRSGKDITLVSWGSTMPICEKAAEALATEDISAEVIDLRSLSPWDKETVIASARKTGKLIAVHEDNHTCGFGGEILATVAETLGSQVRLARVTQPDTFIPFDYAAQLAVLPSLRGILSKAAEMLGYDLSWQQASHEEKGYVVINAIGSSPSDKTVNITQIHVTEGQKIEEDALLFSVEADKAATEINTPTAGTITKILVTVGDSVTVGTPIMHVLAEKKITPLTKLLEEACKPIFKKRPTPKAAAPSATVSAKAGPDIPVILSSISSTVGSRAVENKELLRGFPQWNTEYVIQRTGVEKRYWVGPNENVVTLAVKACKDLFAIEKISIQDIDAIVCSTGTPLSATPSLACRILKELTPEGTDVLMQAHDVNAACTGYLYALQTAHDIIKCGGGKKVLVITSETVSPLLNQTDLNTLFLFGDAATASLVTCEHRSGNINAVVHRPVLSAQGAEEKILYVPFQNTAEHMVMDGQPVFKLAVRKLSEMMDRACTSCGITMEDLSMIVPHQANERIIDAVRKSINRNIHFPTEKMFSHIREYGNTSSNSIPLALTRLMPQATSGGKVGLCAFGGGFTFGAAVLEVM